MLRRAEAGFEPVTSARVTAATLYPLSYIGTTQRQNITGFSPC